MSDQPAHVQLFLTSTNADVSVADRDGRTALNFAVLNFSPSCIKVSEGEHPSPMQAIPAFSSMLHAEQEDAWMPVTWESGSGLGMTLDYCCTVTVGSRLLQLQVTEAYYFPTTSDQLQAILDCCESAVNLIDNKGRTALHYACAEGSADCVRTLLAYRTWEFS